MLYAWTLPEKAAVPARKVEIRLSGDLVASDLCGFRLRRTIRALSGRSGAGTTVVFVSGRHRPTTAHNPIAP